MTAQEIVDRYRSGAQTPERLKKAEALAQRMKVEWSTVLALLEKGA
jgi:hypothetical protein